MKEVGEFLRDAASLAGVEPRAILARVLHVEDGALTGIVAPMDEPTRALVIRLDRELRVRTPGLHYVERKMFLGYRREGATSTPVGERSQIFASLIRNNTRLEVVLPVAPGAVASIAYAQDLTGKGHHGVGDVRVQVANDADLDRFLSDFDHWLRPHS